MLFFGYQIHNIFMKINKWIQFILLVIFMLNRWFLGKVPGNLEFILEVSIV